MLSLTILLVYYLICRVCTLFSKPSGDDDEQEDYAHMGGWRQSVVVKSGMFLSRLLLFVIGFYWISETHTILTHRNSEVIIYVSMYICSS